MKHLAVEVVVSQPVFLHHLLIFELLLLHVVEVEDAVDGWIDRGVDYLLGG